MTEQLHQTTQLQKGHTNAAQDAKKEIFERKTPETGGPLGKLKDRTNMVM